LYTPSQTLVIRVARYPAPKTLSILTTATPEAQEFNIPRKALPRVIVVAGAGKHFGAGHDMGSKQAQLEEENNPRDKTPLGFLKDMETGSFPGLGRPV
jgi:hypothetical protein